MSTDDPESSETLAESVGICAGGFGDENIKGCDDEIQKMTPQAVCKAVQEKKKSIWDAVASVAKSAASLGKAAVSPLSTMMDSMSSDAVVSNNMQNNMNIRIDTTTIIDQVSECDNIISQLQQNIIRGSEAECIDAWARAGFTPKQIAKMSTVKISNVDQQNIQEASANCEMNMAIEALSQMDASIDNLAMQDAMAESKGLLAKTSTSQNTCNAINNSMSACKYIKQQMCCASQINQHQQNVIETGCSTGTFNDINQSNSAEAYATCQQSATSSVSDTTSTDITNKTSQEATAKATGLDMGMILAIVAVCVVGGIAGKYFLSKKKEDEEDKEKKLEDQQQADAAEQQAAEQQAALEAPELLEAEAPESLEAAYQQAVAPQQQAATGGKYMRTRGRKYTRTRGGKSEDTTAGSGSDSGPTFSKMNIFFLVTGILEVIAGLVCIILYITTQKKSLGPVINKPFVRCEQTQILASEFKDTDDPQFDETIDLVSQGTARSTFGQIKAKAETTNGVIGYDFFPDDISLNPNDIPDSQLGLGVFLVDVDKEDREKYNCPPINTEEEISVSRLYAKSNILLLILGIVLVIGGIIQTVLTFF